MSTHNQVRYHISLPDALKCIVFQDFLIPSVYSIHSQIQAATEYEQRSVSNILKLFPALI